MIQCIYPQPPSGSRGTCQRQAIFYAAKIAIIL